MGSLKTMVIAAVLVLTLAGCDATTSGVQVQSPSPYPYNPRW